MPGTAWGEQEEGVPQGSSGAWLCSLVTVSWHRRTSKPPTWHSPRTLTVSSTLHPSCLKHSCAETQVCRAGGSPHHSSEHGGVHHLQVDSPQSPSEDRNAGCVLLAGWTFGECEANTSRTLHHLHGQLTLSLTHTRLSHCPLQQARGHANGTPWAAALRPHPEAASGGAEDQRPGRRLPALSPSSP